MLVPESVWKKLIEWYGGGPEFPRRRINGNQIELYPRVLYAYLCGSYGIELKQSASAFIMSCKRTMREVRRILRSHYNRSGKSNLWYRPRGTFAWTKIDNLDLTIEGIEAFDGDHIMLELMYNGTRSQTRR